MGDNRLWVRDINILHELGKARFGAIADDVNASKVKVSALNLNPAAFGENPIKAELEKAYEDVRGQFTKQLNAAYEGFKDSGTAITKAADHYRAIEKKLSS